jgi:hypothetical protein
MASVNVNSGVYANTAVKLTRGKPIGLGTLGANGNVVVFTVPEPSRDHQGYLTIQVGSTGALTGGTFALELSLDGGTSYAVLTGTTLVLTGQPGADTPAIFAAQYNIGGYGSGALFKFGLSAYTSGTGVAYALIG